jgi:PKD repeat protein
MICFGQDKSNRGKEFWLGYGFNYKFLNELPLNNQELAIYISTIEAATVTVSINGTSFSQTINIPANTADASILIPKSGANDARVLTDGFSPRGIHIVSNVPVAVYAHVYGPMVSGATMLMPVETYGFSYYSINYYQTTSQSNPPDWYSWFYVIASENNTRVLITPSDTTKNGWLPGQTYTVNLNKGEMYHVFGKAGSFNTSNYELCSKDMTGSKIVSTVGSDGVCHPIAVFSGSGGIRLCRGDGGEFMHQQVYPSQAWGTRYLTYHTINNTNTNILETNRNYYRICVQDPNTVVKKNGVVMTGLIKNFFYEYMDSTGGDYIEADKPILVSQYMVNKNQCWNFPTSSPTPPSYGDPEMFYISPIEQGQKSVLFYVSRKSGIDYVYANIYIPTAGVSSLLVNGNPLPAANIIPHPNLPGYSVALARFTGPAGTHTIKSDSAFNATVYGLGNYESYGYNVGTLINNLNYFSEIKNVENYSGQVDSFSCPKTPLRLFIKLGFPAVNIHWKLSQVNGIFPNTDSVISNPVPIHTEMINGRTYYVYSLEQDFTFAAPGTYTIPVTYGASVIENCSQSENAAVQVIIRPGPMSDFTFSSGLCLSDTVQFNGSFASGDFNINAYRWTFADNSIQQGINASKLFSTPGPQPVNFQVFASNGCVGDTTKAINIQSQPTAQFGIPSQICFGETFTISDSSTILNGTINNWSWNMGDGTSVIRNSSVPFTHAYASPGNYNVSLVANSDNGCKSDTITKTVMVLAKPTTSFSFNRNICLGDSILFTPSGSVTGGNITQWNWNFGNGITSSLTNGNPFYQSFSTIGTFPVSITVMADNGCSSENFQLPVSVLTRPAASFTLNGRPCVDSSFVFTSSLAFNSVAPATYYWDFGDGQSVNITNSASASHSYNTTANALQVRHSVSYGPGCSSDTSFQAIPVIYPNPVAQFSIDPGAACENSAIAFSSGMTGNFTWNWNFGNGTGNSAPPFFMT